MHSAFEAYKAAHEDGEAGIEQFYNVKQAREQAHALSREAEAAYAKATSALSKAQRNNQAAQKNSAAASLFVMPNEFDDQFAQTAKDNAEASEKAVAEASKAKEHAKQVSVACDWQRKTHHTDAQESQHTMLFLIDCSHWCTRHLLPCGMVRHLLC